MLTVGEMEGFFAGSREAEEGSHDVEEVHEEVVGQTPEHRLETSEDTLRSFADVAPFPPIDLAARFHIVEFPEELVTEMELEMTLAPVLEEEEEEGETDTQEAREARWAAVVDSAEQSASSASLTEEDESGFPWTPPPPCLASSVAAEPLAAEPPVAKDVLSRTSTMLFRLGLGTVGRGYSVTSIGLGTRSASGRSVSGTLRANGKGKGLVQDWILRGDAGGTVPGDTACHIDVRACWRARKNAADRNLAVRSSMAARLSPLHGACPFAREAVLDDRQSRLHCLPAHDRLLSLRTRSRRITSHHDRRAPLLPLHAPPRPAR